VNATECAGQRCAFAFGRPTAGVDLRGRYGSGGTSYLYWHQDWKQGGFEGTDVQGAINWLGEPPWSTGKVAMQGPSYLAMVQWMGAYLGSPYLTALVPECSPRDHYNNVYPGGAFQLGNSTLFLTKLGGSHTNNDDLRPLLRLGKSLSPPASSHHRSDFRRQERATLAGFPRSQ
jgi:putative CocE/NonD family hydrolase